MVDQEDLLPVLRHAVFHLDNAWNQEKMRYMFEIRMALIVQILMIWSSRDNTVDAELRQVRFIGDK